MKIKLNYLLQMALLPAVYFGQAPNLGTSANFVLFSTNGAVGNSGNSLLTGNIGTNNGSSTAFGNVDGGMHDADGVSAQCATDVLFAYNQLNNATPVFFPAPLLGNGQVLLPGVYSISGNATLNLDLILNAQNDPNAVFIIQIQGAFSTNASAKVKLVNGALACNVFWKVEGMINMASGTTMRGTLIANNAAISMATGDTLEGRAFSTAGAITVNNILARIPIGCGSTVLDGPAAPPLGAAACYAVFSSIGAVSNTGTTYITGDVGSNSSAPTGYNPLYVNGMIHNVPDGSTAQCASDLLVAYNYLNALPADIELLYPAQFGNNLILTPHTYLLNSAVAFTDTVYLDAQGNPNAVFVIKVNGAFSTSTYSKVKLINGAQSKNTYWKIEGAVTINDYSAFKGTIICNNGALGAINTGVTFEGRSLTTNGALSTMAMTTTVMDLPNNCAATGTVVTNTNEMSLNESVNLFPNPFKNTITLQLNSLGDFGLLELRIYTMQGKEVLKTEITKTVTAIHTGSLLSGMYFYKVSNGHQTLKSGKLFSDN